MRKSILSKEAQRVRAAWAWAGAYTHVDSKRAEWTPAEIAYYVARREHAMLLRCEGASYKEIGRRLGVSPYTAKNCIWRAGKRLAHAMRHTKVYFTTATEE